MTSDVLVLDAATEFSTLLGEATARGGMAHIVVTQTDAVVGVLRVNTEPRRALGASGDPVTPGALASRQFTLVPPAMVVFDEIATMWRPRAIMAVVADTLPAGAAPVVRGVITKEHVADSVAAGIHVYSG